MFGFGFDEEEAIEALSELSHEELDALSNAVGRARARKFAKNGRNLTNHGSPAPKAPPFPEIDMDTQPCPIKACDCGAAKAGGKHSDWCSLSA